MNKKKIIELTESLHKYKHLASYYQKKYNEANHLYNYFKTWTPPGHFYSPYPDLKDISKRKASIFDRSKNNISGIDIREKQQLELLKKLSRYYSDLPYSGKRTKELRYYFDNTAYSYTDGVVLFCMLNYLKPKRIIEIGSGYSSALMLDVNERFFNNEIKLTFIDPYPKLFKSLTKRGDSKNYRLIDKNLSFVDNKVFDQLKGGDLLFIDSTHVSKVGSDVNQIYFDILPRLKKDVAIHIHDIFYPFEYPIEWIKEGRAWNEDYLLRAFLHNNYSYEIMFFNSFMEQHHSKELYKALPLAEKNTGGSIWLKKVGNN